MFEGRKYGALIRSPLYPPVLLALRLALCVLLAALLVLGDVTTALIVAVFLALSFAHLLRSEQRPTVFDVLFALAALAGPWASCSTSSARSSPTTSLPTPSRRSR